MKATEQANHALKDCTGACQDNISAALGSLSTGDEKAFKATLKNVELEHLGYVKDQVYKIRGISHSDEHSDPWLKILEEMTDKKQPGMLDKVKVFWDKHRPQVSV